MTIFSVFSISNNIMQVTGMVIEKLISFCIYKQHLFDLF